MTSCGWKKTGRGNCLPTRRERPEKEMDMPGTEAETQDRLQRLLNYLEADPHNPSLLGDAAAAAVDARQPQQAMDLLDRLAGIRELSDEDLHVLGLAALHLQDHQRACAVYRSLLGRGIDDPGVRYNHAWALLKLGEKEEALALLDESCVAAVPQGATLKVQLLHDQGEMEAAQEVARSALERHSDHPALLAAISVLAVDLGDLQLARDSASGAGDHPDALATLGTLALEDDEPQQARALFDRALKANPNSPRALVGRGLSLLSQGDAESAAGDLDKGAELFGGHLGSFIAAGWAHFIARDLGTARARFEHALALDPNFAESHGSLAVLDLLEGRPEQAEREMAIAFRLDRACYSAALAQVLLRAGKGDQEGARRIFDKAIHTPIEGGRTIAQALGRIGLAGP
jgi:tetratricopeptide (TPR) repeat protein